MSSLRRVAFVANYPWKLVDSTTRYELYIEGMARIGIDAITVCRDGSQAGYELPVIVVRDDETLRDHRFWTEVKCDAAVVWSWFQHVPLMRAIRSAGVKVLALGDSDGLVSPMYHHVSAVQNAFSGSRPTFASLLWKSYCHFRTVLRGAGRLAHRQLAECVLTPTVYTLPSTGAIAKFDHVMRRTGHDRATGVVRWLPYAIPEYLTRGDVAIERPRRMVAVGRWDAWQKNAPLLEQSMRRVLSQGIDLQFVLIGRGGQEAFGTLIKDYPSKVQVSGLQSREFVTTMMANSRAQIFSSRWEGSPVSANEMLATGGTIVGTPIPSLVGIVDGRRFGQVSRRHSPNSLAEAIIAEAAAWDCGKRNPRQIAEYWRPLLSPEGVARRIIDLLEAAAGRAR